MATSMPTRRRATPTEPRKERTSAPTLVQKPLAPLRNVDLRATIDAQDTCLRTKDYRMIGRVSIIRTDRGDIEFRGDGPVIAHANLAPADLVILSDWPGSLPTLRELTQEACPDCLTKCDECTNGERNCTTCGGSGKNLTFRKPCPTCVAKKGRFNPGCRTCSGRGEITDPKPCKMCDGKKVITCVLCQGAGKMSTGNMGGSKKWTDPDCASCAGQKRKAVKKEQKLETFLQGTLEGMPALGPIRRIIVHTGSEKLMTTIDVEPDSSGNLMVMLLRSPQAGSRMYMIGGRMHFAA